MKFFGILSGILIFFAISTYLFFVRSADSINWKSYNENDFKTSADYKATIIDFYADWCVPCKEMDKTTFSDKNIINRMNRLLTLKADLTKSASTEVEKIRDKFKINAMPTVLIFNSKGEEIKRLVGYVSPGEFNKILDQLNL